MMNERRDSKRKRNSDFIKVIKAERNPRKYSADVANCVIPPKDLLAPKPSHFKPLFSGKLVEKYGSLKNWSLNENITLYENENRNVNLTFLDSDMNSTRFLEKYKNLNFEQKSSSLTPKISSNQPWTPKPLFKISRFSIDPSIESRNRNPKLTPIKVSNSYFAQFMIYHPRLIVFE